MDPRLESMMLASRRSFLSRSASCLGLAALATLAGEDAARPREPTRLAGWPICPTSRPRPNG